jgi:2',3'-cyclic-nucleotide 2'-phosphodiesterase (5'-nucleotidase family)
MLSCKLNLTMQFRFVILPLLLPAALFARQVPITILHTCDLHGNVLPTESYEGQTNLGGIARCATVIRQVRASEKNVLLVDAGDTIQGAPVSFYSQGRVMVKALNLLRYDAWCWGNHEFDWGLEKLAACAEKAEVPILNANVTGESSPDGTHPQPLQRRGAGPVPLLGGAGVGNSLKPAAEQILSHIKPYRLLDVDGVKVGIIGLNTPGIPNWSRPRLIAGLKFADSVETLRPIIPALRRAGAQVLVLVCHQGYRDNGDDHANQVNAIARTFPELDVIIGGHTHRHFPEFKIGNVLYCQANYYGIHLGRVDLVYDTDAGRLVRRESKTMLMDGTIPLDKKVLKACGAELDRAQKTLATVLGEAAEDFDARGQPKRETPVHNLICEAIAESLRQRGVRVDAVVHGLFGTNGLRKGAITLGDVWKIVPYENTVGVLQLTPAQLKDALEENAAAYERRDFRGIWGLRITLDPTAPAGNRVATITRPDGSPLNDDERLAVAFNSYELASGGLRWNKLRALADAPDTKLAEFDIQSRQAVMDFIRRRGRIAPVTNGWWKAERGAPVTAPATR